MTGGDGGMDAAAENIFGRLARGLPAVWRRVGSGAPPAEIDGAEVDAAEERFRRFAPALRAAFPQTPWDGRIRSELLTLAPQEGLPELLVKADHALPLTGSIKARGGVHELLWRIEEVARAAGVLDPDDYASLLAPAARAVLAGETVMVASTGNLGFSIGLVARAFGLQAEVHMSHDAKAWKKERLRRIGARVVEYQADYTEAVAGARAAAAGRARTHFVDDENSRRLFVGYATAARALVAQRAPRGPLPPPPAPRGGFLPCGGGGAPGGITFGLKRLLGAAVVAVFVEPVASACVLAALLDPRDPPPSVYDHGLDNRTIADGLAVPRASALVLRAVGPAIDAAVAVPDDAMRIWVRRAWTRHGLRLEPSAAAAFAAVPLFLAASLGEPALARATHLVWTTGGSLVPQEEFAALLDGPA